MFNAAPIIHYSAGLLLHLAAEKSGHEPQETVTAIVQIRTVRSTGDSKPVPTEWLSGYMECDL